MARLYPHRTIILSKITKADLEIVSKIRMPEANLDEYATMASSLVEEFDLMLDSK